MVDNFFHLYLIAFPMIIYPAFYLNGDIKFRNDLQNLGFFVAMKEAFFTK